METTPTTNPAGRLHQILTKAQAAIKSQGTPRSAINLWTRVFEVSGESESGRTEEVIYRLIQLKRLIAETREALAKIEGLPERHFRPFGRIMAIPDTSLARLNEDVTNALLTVTEGDLTVLEFCSDTLEARYSEPVIEEKELQDILEDVNALFEEVRASENLNEDLQSFILDGLESLRRGIYEFRIRGPERLKEAIAEVLADYMVNQRTPQTPEEKDSLERFNNAFARFVSLVTLGAQIRKLIDVVTGPLMIGPGQPPPDTSSH